MAERSALSAKRLSQNTNHKSQMAERSALSAKQLSQIINHKFFFQLVNV